ncbi:hypothetical protein GWC77_09435 [Paraburkholderia sp. NMBU_R16]|uniref:hypothetical protein n=1 Tax=Paraburkholderia sp. NMBU_R16 TaxID=2698676 RepID=UPI00156314B9|nr:hypothetical protein [Paraburkholderia sp. NMBU_R16]NRO96158.1 hypothetical protein [Paraburkholderia sp. NMBU_R16]
MLPIATKNDLGAVKIGAGLQTDDAGTLSVIDEGSAGSVLSMIVTYGSPRADNSMATWLPANIVSVYGPPGMPVLVTVTDGATFVDPDPGSADMKSLQLSARGTAQAQVQLAAGSGDRAVSVVAAPYIQPADVVGAEVLAALAVAGPVQCPAFFYPTMHDASWKFFQTFGYTRGAPSDGVTPCVVSVFVDTSLPNANDIQKLQMKVTSGDAVFDKGAQTATPAITQAAQDVGLATANIYSASPGVSTIEVSVPNDVFPDKALVYVSFVALPVNEAVMHESEDV